MPFLIGKPTPNGYASLIDNTDGKVNPNGRILKEADSYTCAHARDGFACQKVIHVPTGTRLEDVADFCRQCQKVICAKCADARVCYPFMKAIEEAEERDFRVREGYGLRR